MNIESLFDLTSDLRSATIEQLLALRLLLDDPEPAHSIEQDIEDLYEFPERLEQSYPQEWRAYIKRKINAKTRTGNRWDCDALKARLNDKESWFTQTYQQGCNAILFCQSLSDADNVSVFPSRYKMQLKKLLE